MTSLLGTRLSHRAFLKLVAAALGGAGAGHLAADAPVASASYLAGPPDVVNTNLTVQGTLVVTSPHSMGIGTTTPAGTLDVAGDIRTSGLVTIASSGVGKQSFYVAGPPTSPPPLYLSGTWGRARASTWSTFTTAPTQTWGDIGTMAGTWQRVGAHTWDWLTTNSYTWNQAQSL